MRRKINIADAEALLKFYKNNDTDWTFANFTGNFKFSDKVDKSVNLAEIKIDELKKFNNHFVKIRQLKKLFERNEFLFYMPIFCENKTTQDTGVFVFVAKDSVGKLFSLLVADELDYRENVLKEK